MIAANVAWKAAYTSSYIGVPLLNVAAIEKLPSAALNIPLMNSRLKPPMNALPSVNASE